MYTIPAPDICEAYAPEYLDNMSIQSEYGCTKQNGGKHNDKI